MSRSQRAASGSELTADNPLSWCRILQRITWTSAPPYGVGTTREARSLGGLERRSGSGSSAGRRAARQSFYAVEVSVPGSSGSPEDYLVEPSSESACRFTWTIAIESKPAARIGDPGTRALLRTLFTDTRKHYAAAGSPRSARCTATPSITSAIPVRSSSDGNWASTTTPMTVATAGSIETNSA